MNSKERRFLFDHNNFDLPDLPPEPEPPQEPPPPLFSLDELGFAKDDAFERGRAAGLAEAEASRAQHLVLQLEDISGHLQNLIAAENYRAAIYEREALSLTETVFRAIFPHFSQSEGLNEVREMIRRVIAHQSGQSAILVELPEGDIEEIMAIFTDHDIDLSRVSFKPSPQLQRGSCRIGWKDGGAMRDQQAIASEALRLLTPQKIEPEGAGLANAGEKDETDTIHEGE